MQQTLFPPACLGWLVTVASTSIISQARGAWRFVLATAAGVVKRTG
jgi:hypothetical protein